MISPHARQGCFKSKSPRYYTGHDRQNVKTPVSGVRAKMGVFLGDSFITTTAEASGSQYQ